MLMLGLEETIDQLAKANGVRWHGHVLRKVNNIVGIALYLKGRLQREMVQPRYVANNSKRRGYKSSSDRFLCH